MMHRQEIPALLGFSLACAWPGLHFFSANVMQFQWMGAAAAVVVALLCVLIWLAGLALAFVPKAFAAGWPSARLLAVMTAVIFLLFFHQSTNILLRSWMELDQNVARWVYRLVVLGMLAVVWRFSRHVFVRTAICLWAGIMLAIAAFTLGAALLHMGRDAQPGPAREELFPRQELSGNNVYYVILDHYAGKDALRQHAGYDNSPFLRKMQEAGFVSIEGARSGYINTYLSLMSILDMDYIVDGRTAHYGNRFGFFPYRLQHGPTPAVVEKLHSAGYRFMHVGNAWAPCVKNREVSCSNREGPWEAYREVVNVFLEPTRLPAFFRSLAAPADALAVLSASIEDIVAARRPVFAFVHSFNPHPPYPRADCSFGPEEDVSRAGYRRAIECVNNSVLTLVRQIRQRDPEAIVVFQADHGSDFSVDWSAPLAAWSDAAIQERTAILNLVHLPQRCRQWSRPALSAINTMRLVYACLENRPPVYLDTRVFLSGYESSSDFGHVLEVTDRLR